MEVFEVMENSYFAINRNFDFYKQNYEHTYYLNVKDDETIFIDRLFHSVNNSLSAQDKMLNYSVSTIFTATAVLTEIMDRNGILYDINQLDMICKGFSTLEKVQFTDKNDEELEEILFGILTDGIDLESRKKSGSERTPKDIISYMLDLIQYKGNDIIGKSIVDPACGTGTFISQIMDRFLEESVYRYNAEDIISMLVNDKLIRAYDMKPANVYVTKLVIVEKLIRNKIVINVEDILRLMDELPVICEDFLKINDKADFVVGNPPYIRLQNLSNEYRDYIKDNYVSATGRFDIYTCFIENANKILDKNGKMCLITSNKYLTANYGIGIRQYLSKRNCVKKIVDLFDTKFFGAAVLPVITLCENNSENKGQVEYIGIKSSTLSGQRICKNARELFSYIENDMISNKAVVNYEMGKMTTFEISHSFVEIPQGGKTWNFASTDENYIKEKLEQEKICTLEDVMEVCVGIKTTADKVFVKPMTEQFVKKHGFEEQVIYPLIQSFDVEKWNVTWGGDLKDRYVLYPHREFNGNMQAIPLKEIPKTKQYLLECQEILKGRKYLTESKTREWYECWVPQKLSKFQQAKIVTRDIVSHNSFAYDNTGKICQGNTFFLTKKDSLFSAKYSMMTEKEYYHFILGVLNSKVMEFYQKMISGCLYSKKYRYTTTNLNRWPVPEISYEQAMQISNFVYQILHGAKKRKNLEDAIDNILYNQFGLTNDEIAKIDEFIQIDE